MRRKLSCNEQAESGDVSGENFVIQLESNGSFPNSDDRLYIVHAKDSISITLDSNKLQDQTPILLTNFPEFCKKNNCFKHPLAPELQPYPSCKIAESELLKKYKIFTGYYNQEGSWQVDLAIHDFDGSLFIQVLFLEQQFIIGQKEFITYKSYGSPEWIVIQPRISVNNKLIGMDQLIIQTVLPYSLGKSEDWLETLKTQTELGYNGFHFPPIQSLGYSGSYYSIKDQLKANKDLFAENISLPFAEMKQIVETLEKDMNALSFVDILLNHTSSDSQWILDEPQAVYNPENSPHLASALELDQSIQAFSEALANHKIHNYFQGSNLIQNEAQLSHLIDIMKNQVFYALKFEEYFIFDKTSMSNLYQNSLNLKNIPVILKEVEVEDDENIFSRSGFDIIFDYIKKNTKNIGKFLFY